MRNLAADPKHAATLAKLDRTLRELMREMKDPLPEEQLFTAAPTAASSATAPAQTNVRMKPRTEPFVVQLHHHATVTVSTWPVRYRAAAGQKQGRFGDVIGWPRKFRGNLVQTIRPATFRPGRPSCRSR